MLKSLKSMVRPIMKLDKWAKGVLFLATILIICLVMNLHIPVQEGFIQRKKFVLKEGLDCYDDFYSEIYDDLVYDEVKNDFEVGELKRLVNITNKSRILDIGSGSGHHVSMFKKLGCHAEGVDISPAMVERAKKKFKDCRFKKGNALDNVIYPRNSFTTVTCLYFTIYYMEDKQKFINNVYSSGFKGGMSKQGFIDGRAVFYNDDASTYTELKSAMDDEIGFISYPSDNGIVRSASSKIEIISGHFQYQKVEQP